MPEWGKQGEGGFALLVVIAVLGVLALLATGFALAAREETQIVRNAVEQARARALADAGVSLAVVGLISRDPAARWRADGRVYARSFGGGEIRESVQDEAGKVDLNWTPVPVIERLLAELGVPPEMQGSIVSYIVARRGRIGRKPAPPAELVADMPGDGPTLRDLAGAPFDAVDELLTLPGMTRAVLDRLRPYVTVYARTARINPATAPREVLLAVPGMSPADVAQVLAARAVGLGGDSTAPMPDLAQSTTFLAISELRAATVTAEGTAGSGARFVRSATIATTSDLYHPFRILEWRRELGSGLPPAPPSVGASLR